MVLVESVEDGESGGGFPQLVSGVVSVKDDIPVSTLTHGPREVTRVLAWDPSNDTM